MIVFIDIFNTNKKYADTLFLGMGNLTMSNADICLLGVKGKPTRASAAVHSVVISHIQKHSQKPREVRNRIVELCENIPRIELFTRQQSEGRYYWGNECEVDN